MHGALFLLWFGWVAPPPASPPALVPPPDRWIVEGDRILDDRDAVELFPWSPGDSIPSDAPAEAARLVEASLRRGGWWAADVRGERRDREIALIVDAGEPVVVGEVEVRGNRELSREEILARMDLRPGRVFDESHFRADAARVLRAYSERGFALARVYPSEFARTEDGRLAFVVRVGEGPVSEIESLRVFGDFRTDERVIARIAGVRAGDRWDVRRIEGMAPRLRREGLFQEVGEPRIVRGSRDNRVGIEIEVHEGPTNSIFGALGYNPGPEGQSGQLVGLIDLRLRNLLGTGRRASLRFERPATDVQDLAFRFREPWILGSPISIEGGAAQSRRDPFYSRTDLDVAFSVPISPVASADLGVERRDSSFDDVTGARVSEVATGGSVGFRYDGRDRMINPSRGFRGELRVGTRRTRAGERRTRLECDAEILVPWSRAFGFAEGVGFRGVESTESTVPLYDQYFVGGTNTVRGYREEQFHGERVWWTRTELRYRLSTRSRAYGFADVGGFDRGAANPASSSGNDAFVGGGIGVSLETRASGIVRFEIALGRGDAFSDAKVHVGLEQEF